MNRLDFIRTTSILAMGLPFANSVFGRSKPNGVLPSGYRMPILLENSLNQLHNGFKGGGNTKSHELVQSGLEIIFDSTKAGNIPSQYKQHQKMSVTPNIGKSALNGKGYMGINPKMQAKMGADGDKVYAINGVHNIRNVDNFDNASWVNYCDLADLQSTEGRVYVTPLDDRKEEYKQTTWIPEVLSYILYNPTYYCFGLPISDPVIVEITDSLGRDIKGKTGKVAAVKSFYKQDFLYFGEKCENKQNTSHTIYWDTDEAIKEYYGLVPIIGCGDPNVGCKGDNAKIARPEIMPK